MAVIGIVRLRVTFAFSLSDCGFDRRLLAHIATARTGVTSYRERDQRAACRLVGARSTAEHRQRGPAVRGDGGPAPPHRSMRLSPRRSIAEAGRGGLLARGGFAATRDIFRLRGNHRARSHGLYRDDSAAPLLAGFLSRWRLYPVWQ